MPLITPPTPPALEADKEAIAAEFERTDKLIQQIQTDTEALKEAEQKRLDALDAAVEELQKVMDTAKSQLTIREQEMRQLQTDIETVKTDLPKYLERVNDAQRKDLLDLQAEIRSLKQIVSNRTKSSVSAPTSNGSSTPPTPTIQGVPSESLQSPQRATPQLPTSTLKPPSRSGIPAWQLAAAKKTANAESPPPTVQTSSSDIPTPEVTESSTTVPT